MLKRFLGPAALAALTVALGTIVPAAPAAAASSEELQLHDMVNQVRASVGVPALELDEGISVVSRAWALQMSIVGDIAHNPNFKTLITGWSRIGENVGMGHPLSVVHQALVTSPAHYANIVEPAYTRIGIGVVDVGGGNVYVVQNFVRPRTLGSVPAPTAPPTTARRAPSTTVASRPAPTRSTAAPVTTHVPAAWAAQAAPAPSAAAAPGAGSRAQATSPVLTYVLAGLRAFDERLRR